MSKKRHEKKQINALHAVLGGKCYLCDGDLPRNEITKDHVFPRTMGYSISYNMMPAHHKCNLEKADRIPTREEIELACETYDAAQMVFAPRTNTERTLFDPPIQHFIAQLAA